MTLLEVIFIIALAIVVITTAIIAGVFYQKTQRKAESILVIKMGGIALVIVALMYGALKVFTL